METTGDESPAGNFEENRIVSVDIYAPTGKSLGFRQFINYPYPELRFVYPESQLSCVELQLSCVELQFVSPEL
jgi:hypothetical protein